MEIHHYVNLLSVYAGVICMVDVSVQKDFPQTLIMLNAKQMENSELGIIELNCSSSRQSFGNGAEFIVNGQTIEHISFNNNKCYNSKIEKCTTEHCQCFPSDNIYIYKFENVLQYHELIIGCLMRFSDNETGSIMKAVMSLKFNGTESEFYEYDVKMFIQDKEENGDNNRNDSSSANIFIWVPVMCGILLVISVAVIVITCRVCRNHAIKRREKTQDEAIAIDTMKTKATFRDKDKRTYDEIAKVDPELDLTEEMRLEKSRSWYEQKVAQLMRQDAAIDEKIQESILGIIREIEMGIISDTNTNIRLRETSRNIYRLIEGFHLDLPRIRTSTYDKMEEVIQGVIVDIILDKTQEIKRRAVAIQKADEPHVFHSSLHDRCSPFNAFSKNLGDEYSFDMKI